MMQNPATTWVWKSTAESRAARLPSVLALSETLICVAIYWMLWLQFGVTWHHWLIVIATPLVLLRSEQSKALGVKWFDDFWDRESSSASVKPAQQLAICVFICATTAVIVWYLNALWFTHFSGLTLFWKSFWLGLVSVNLSVAILIATARKTSQTLSQIAPFAMTMVIASAAASTVVVVAALTTRGSVDVLGVALGVFSSIFAGPGIFLGFGLRAAAVRFLATARYAWAGVRTLPKNWHFSIMVSDFAHSPELIPGHKELTFGQEFSFSFQNIDGSRKKPEDWFRDALGSLIFFVPTMLWRWAVKSTAWFYVPLLWVRRGWLSLEGEDLRIWAQSYSRKAINWLWLLFGGFSFAALAVWLFSFEKWLALKSTTAEAGAPMGLFGFLASLNWVELLTKPWLWAYTPSYALTIIIFFALDSIAAEIRAGATPESRAASIARWKWAANARAMLTNVGLLLALWYFLGAVDAWEQMRSFFAHWF